MIVADASVVVELLLYARRPAGVALGRRMALREVVYAPHLLDAEVGQVLRRLVLRGELSAPRAEIALGRLKALPIQRYAHGWLLPRAFELRDNVTVYDGLYLALTEALDVPFLSCDTRLRDIPGCLASVEILPATA